MRTCTATTSWRTSLGMRLLGPSTSWREARLRLPLSAQSCRCCQGRRDAWPRTVSTPTELFPAKAGMTLSRELLQGCRSDVPLRAAVTMSMYRSVGPAAAGHVCLGCGQPRMHMRSTASPAILRRQAADTVRHPDISRRWRAGAVPVGAHAGRGRRGGAVPRARCRLGGIRGGDCRRAGIV